MESVNDDLAWIRHERMLLDLAIEMSIPILGICFGAQHLAQALGAVVQPMTRPVIGLIDIEQCQPNTFLSDLNPQFKAIGIHQDHILPCDHIKVVAQSGGVVSAFTAQEKFFGLQFHPELTNQLLFDLLEKRVKLEFNSQALRDDALCLRGNVQLHEAHLQHVASSIAEQFYQTYRRQDMLEEIKVRIFEIPQIEAIPYTADNHHFEVTRLSARHLKVNHC